MAVRVLRQLATPSAVAAQRAIHLPQEEDASVRAEWQAADKDGNQGLLHPQPPSYLHEDKAEEP
jgi:hypothetical protein